MKTGIMITALLGTVAITSGVWAQGSLTPPGAPAPTMRSLEEIYSAVTSGGAGASETRTAISTLPFTITESGSYYVISNLTMTATGQNGIYVNADDVTIDLNGFTLTGPGDDSGGGIVNYISNKGCRVFNGIVRNWKGGYGVSLSTKSQIQNVLSTENARGLVATQIESCQAIKNTYGGIYGGISGLIRNCKTAENGYWGIYSGQCSTIENCQAYYNGYEGILGEYQSVIRGCTAFANQHSGIKGEKGSSIIQCASTSNERSGIEVNGACIVKNCTVSYNGNRPTTQQDGAGIQVDSTGNIIEENALYDNMWGIYVTGNASRMEKNTITGPNTLKGLYITGNNNHLSDNQVSGTEDNYDIAEGNQLNILLCEIPETLDWPCSVKLAGTLSMTNESINGITVNADNVSIDLDGHALTGPGSQSGHGIFQSDIFSALRVKNGSLKNWQGSAEVNGYSVAAVGLHGRNNTVSDISVSFNHTGISVGNHGTVKNCMARQSNEYGYQGSEDCLFESNLSGEANEANFKAEAGSRFVQCTASGGQLGFYGNSDLVFIQCTAKKQTKDAYQDGGIGFDVDDRCSFTDCLAADNEDSGFYAKNKNTFRECTAQNNEICGFELWDGEGNRVEHCRADNNLGTGIWVDDYSFVLNCIAFDNGNKAASTLGHGIQVGGLCRVDSNEVYDNFGYAIYVYGRQCRITRNHAFSNFANYIVDEPDYCGLATVHQDYTDVATAGPLDNF